MKKSFRILITLVGLTVFSFFLTPARAQTPALVYSNSLAAPGESGNGFRIQYGGAMGTGSLAGNLVTLRITAPHGSTISSITDNLSDTYTLGVSADSGIWRLGHCTLLSRRCACWDHANHCHLFRERCRLARRSPWSILELRHLRLWTAPARTIPRRSVQFLHHTYGPMRFVVASMIGLSSSDL